MPSSANLLLVEAEKEAQNEYLFQCKHDDADSLADEEPGLGPGRLIVRDHIRVEDIHEHDRLDQIDDEDADDVRDDEPLDEPIRH